MTNLSALLAPLALMLPFGIVPATGDTPEDRQVWQQAKPAKPPVTPLPLSDRAPGWSPLFDAGQPATANQVRIERRVIIRISPAPGHVRRSLTAEPSRRAPAPPRLVERPHGDCLDSADIAAVSTGGARLLIYMRDRALITAQLENGCSPRDFYQGFYMERSSDGKLCVRRDKLLSRSGAKCEVAKLHKLVEVTPQ